MRPSPPLGYKATGSTLHRDVTPAYDSLPSPVPSLSFSSSFLTLTIHTLHESARLCGNRHLATTTFHVSHHHPVQFQKHFFFHHSRNMTAILRSLFGSGQSTTPAHGKAKTRSRTESTPAPSPYYVYTSTPGITPSTSTSSSGTSHSSKGHNTPAISSSPLRYPTYDSRHSHEHSRPPLYRATSHKQPHPDMQGP